MNYFDLGMKLELVLWDLQALIYLVSLIELSGFALAMVFMLKLEGMSTVYLFIPHALRGVTGMLINRKMPRTHQFVEDISMPETQPDSHLKFDVVQAHVRESMLQLMNKVFTEMNPYMMAYALFTVLCNITDLVAFIIILAYFGVAGEESQEMILFLLNLAFLFTLYLWISFIC